MFDAALSQPMSLSSTFFDQAKGGVLESFGAGTVIKDLMIPEGAPTQEDILRSTLRLGIGNPVLSAYEMMRMGAQSVLDQGKPLAEDAYKASPYFRGSVPWDAGMTDNRAASLAMMDDAKKVREYFAEKRPFTAFVGNLSGQALDPVNYIPVAGPMVKAAAAARFGRVAGAAVTGALDAATNTALFGAVTAPERARYGDDVSWQSTVSQIATAALIGAAFGTIGGALEGRADAKVRSTIEERLATLKTTQEARIALNEAIGAVANGEDVALSPNSTQPLARVAQEVDQLGKAYDQVKASPTGGVRDPLVAITPGDIEGTIVARGAFKDINEVEFSKRGWGLVKIIWRHGTESHEEPAFQVSKEDVTALPNVVREFSPSSVSADGRLREWRVERDGRVVVYADTLMPEGRHVATTYIQRPNAPGAETPLSPKRKPATAGSSSEPLKPVRDTNPETLPSSEGGQPSPANANIDRSVAVDNSAPRSEPIPEGRSEAETRIAKPDDFKAIAAQHGVDPEAGSFVEEADIARMATEGRLTEDDTATLTAAQNTFEDGIAYGEALKSMVGCLLL